jgi:hypothetical protein
MVVTGSPEDSNWMQLVEEAADLMLGIAANEADVMSIYKKNKQLFEEVKAHDPDFFKQLVDKFSKRKAEFQ